MIIDWVEYEDRQHVLSWVLLEAMSQTGIEKFGDFDSSKLEVKLTVNGIDTPFLEAMEFLQKQLSDIEEAGRQKGLEEARYIINNNVHKLLGEGEVQ